MMIKIFTLIYQIANSRTSFASAVTVSLTFSDTENIAVITVKFENSSVVLQMRNNTEWQPVQNLIRLCLGALLGAVLLGTAGLFAQSCLSESLGK